MFGCLQGGALVSSAPTEQRWCTSCYVGALETSAPPEVSSFCVNLCNLWENIRSKKFCEFSVFCGRSSPAEGSVNSVQSVGGPLFAWLVQQRLLHPLKLHLCNLWEDLSHPNHLCKSVKSVGGHPQASRSNPWEPLRSHRFSPHYKHCVLFRAAHGAWADRCRDGADRNRGRISCTIALKTLQ